MCQPGQYGISYIVSVSKLTAVYINATGAAAVLFPPAAVTVGVSATTARDWEDERFVAV